MGKFEDVYAINVNEKVEKKGSQTYLSWAFAWAEFKKIYPEATYKIERFGGAFCVGNEKMGYMVATSVTADGLTYEMWLPVMDMRNKSILQPTTFDVNKAIMRCLTKNLAMFGLGLYIYAGEDLPEGAQGEEQVETDDKEETFQPLTKSEMVSKWGVKNVEKTLLWYEDQLGMPYAEWGKEEHEAVREVLKQQKEKREAEEKRKAGLNKIDDKDIPFQMED